MASSSLKNLYVLAVFFGDGIYRTQIVAFRDIHSLQFSRWHAVHASMSVDVLDDIAYEYEHDPVQLANDWGTWGTFFQDLTSEIRELEKAS